jgi:hypothetical protein
VDLQGGRERIGIELRIGARAGDCPDVDDEVGPSLPQ